MMFVLPRRGLWLTIFFLFLVVLIKPVWAQTPLPLNYGQNLMNSIDGIGEVDIYTFDGQANDRVIVTMVRTLGILDPQIVLRRGSDDSLICQSTNTSAAWAEVNDCQLPTDGQYKIYAGDYQNNDTGSYRIHLQRLNNPASPTSLAFGQTLNSNITFAAEMDSFTFNGTTGDRVMIAGVITLGSLDPLIRLYRPNGTMVCESFASSGMMAEINECTLPSDGTYTILFGDYQFSETGNYGLYLQRLNNPGGSTTLAFGQSTGGDISLVPKMDTYTFSGEAGSRVLITMAVTLGALDPQIRLYRPDGTLLCVSSINGNAAEINGCLLSDTGTYTLLINDFGDTDTGNYRIYLQKLTSAVNPTPLSFGIPLTADISLAAEMDTYTFNGIESDRVLISMAVSSGLLDPQIRLYGPTGTQVCTQAQSSSGGGAEINECPLPATGTYQIMVGDYGGTETGNYGIFLQRLNQPGQSTAITYGQTFTRDIILPAEMDTFTFVGTTNDRVMIDMAVTLGGLDPQIRLFRPDGTLLCSAFSTSGGSTEINQCILPVNGTYTVLAQDYENTEAGNYRIYLQRLSNPANATPISFGQTLRGDIALAAEMDVYSLNASAGDRVMIAVAVSTGLLNPKIRLYDQSGTPVCQSSPTSGGAVEINECLLPINGTYTIITNDQGNTKIGNYGIYTQRLNNPLGVNPFTYGQTLTGDILDPAEMDTFTFSGTAGERILINMAVTLGALDPQIRLYRPNGSLLCSAYGTNSGSTEIYHCILLDTGTYTVLANDYGNTENGNYRIYLQRPSNPVDTIPLSFGQTLIGEIAQAAEMDVYSFNASGGDRVMIAMAVYSGLLNPQIRLYDPEGDLICQKNATSGSLAEINDCPLPANGTYIVIANGYGNINTGNYGIFLQRLNNPAIGTTLGFGQVVNGEITQPAEMKTYTFQANANDRAVFSMKATSGNLDPQIRLYRLNGTLLCSGYSTNGGTGQTSTCVFPETGMYTILTNDYGGTDTGGFTLMSRLPESGLLDINPVTGLIASGLASGPFSPSSTNYSLRNIGGGTINWTASKTQPWISISETSDILTAGETKSISVSINQEAKNLSPGLYLDTITFNNTTNGNGNAVLPVSLTVDLIEPEMRIFLPLVISK